MQSNNIFCSPCVTQGNAWQPCITTAKTADLNREINSKNGGLDNDNNWVDMYV